MDQTTPTVPTRIRTAPSWLLGRAHTRAHRVTMAGFAAVGVRAYHYRLMAALGEWGPASQADLGRSTSIDRSDVVTAVSELESDGLVARVRDPAHGRRNIVSLTPEGQRRLRALDDLHDQTQAEVLAPLTAAERIQLVQLLDKLGTAEIRTEPGAAR